MGEELVTLEDEEVYFNIADDIDETTDYIGEINTSINSLLGDTDKRIKDYYKDHFEAISDANDTLQGDNDKLPDVSNWLTDTTNRYQEIKQETENNAENFDTGANGVSGYTPTQQTAATTKSPSEMTIDPTSFSELPEEAQKAIVEELKQAGYTDTEIDDIIAGNVPVDTTTTEKIKATIAALVAENKDVAALLLAATGFSLLDENGNVDVNKVSVAELIAGKNLGMEIDMTPGSPFKKHLNELSNDIVSVNSSNPDLRQAIIDQYGFDIFNEDGTIDQNRLALVRIVDGQDLNDEYDVVKLVEKYKNLDPTKTTENPVPEDPTIVEPEPVSPISSPESTPPPVNPEPVSPGTSAPGTDAPPITTGPVGTVTPIPGIPTEDPSTGGFGDGTGSGGVGSTGTSGTGFASDLVADGKEIAANVTEGLGAVGEGILGAIDKGASKLASVTPYKSGGVGTGSNAGVNANKATAGIIAAASVAAGGAAAGGGVLIHKKISVLRFTPDDWRALGEDYQGIIEKLMKKVGFTEDEIETFKTSNFKITTAEMREHTKKIDKALDINPACEDELLKLYNYSIFDENAKVIDYLLFITMIIDGKNSIDEYNMYNVINQSFENVDEADFIYSGIAMEDYYDELAKDEEPDIRILNDPTETELKDDSKEPEGELEEANPSIDKDWLKGIGIDE